jgi:hypothetical protein
VAGIVPAMPGELYIPGSTGGRAWRLEEKKKKADPRVCFFPEHEAIRQSTE